MASRSSIKSTTENRIHIMPLSSRIGKSTSTHTSSSSSTANSTLRQGLALGGRYAAVCPAKAAMKASPTLAHINRAPPKIGMPTSALDTSMQKM